MVIIFFQASNEAEVLKIMELHKNKIDLVLTDVVLPGKSGKEIISELQKNIPGLKYIFMSGYLDETVAKHGIMEADLNFIQKPFNSMDLIKMVREILDKNAEK